ncbi:MAG: ribosome biogenesis GTPase Der [Caulobacteraceae bacterium]
MVPGSAPRIAIVGRPNVGKSTLFNRLAGARLAIVHALPGATRDVRTAPARLGDLVFEAVDTAGLEALRDDSLAARMSAASEAAAARADLSLFVIDGRAGVTAEDRTFAETLRRGGAAVVLAVNKCEGRAGSETILDAWSLGLGEPVAISAEHGEGLGDLYAAITARLQGEPTAEESGEPDTERPVLMAIVGRPNAGKSTLANRLIGEERLLTGPEAGITRDSIWVDWSFEGRPMRLADTAGLRRKAKVAEGLEKLAVADAIIAAKRAEVVLLVMDAGHPFETQDLQIADLMEREGRALVLVLAKWDLETDSVRRLAELDAEARARLPQLGGAALVALSAETGAGMDRLMPAVLAAQTDWRSRLRTSDLNAWLAGALERLPPPSKDGRRPKLRYMVQTRSRPPTFVIFTGSGAEVGQAYRRYLVNSLRRSFDLAGAPIRLSFRAPANPYKPPARPIRRRTSSGKPRPTRARRASR